MKFSSVLSKYRKTPAEAMMASHNMEDGDPCWSCGCAFDLANDYPSSWCVHCKAYFPRRCAGCSTVVMPTEPGPYGEPTPLCETCVSDKGREQREKMVERIPDHVLRPAMCNYKGYGHRRNLDQEIRRYLRGETLSPNLFVYGPPGTGKTVSVARCAWRLVTEEKDLRSFVWVCEGEMVRFATETKYGIIGERFHEMVHCDLLVIDEVGSAFLRANDQARGRIVDLMRTRLETLSKRTIFISNKQPLMGATFGEAVGSRFKGTSQVVYVDGPDLRQEQ